jgi:hypothetical protein
MPLPLKLFEISDIVLQDNKKGTLHHWINSGYLIDCWYLAMMSFVLKRCWGQKSSTNLCSEL